uniref:Uncharacterized protein n=1 Tax=Anguilla anguilla TaxID=7936 RepID=A0A0E9R311_ANGAN
MSNRFIFTTTLCAFIVLFVP